MSLLLSPVGAGGVLVVGVIAGYFLRRWLALQQKESIEREAKNILEKSKAEARELLLEAKNEAAKAISIAQEEERNRKKELYKLEERLVSKEDSLEKQRSNIEEEVKKQKEEFEKIKAIEGEAKGLHEKIIGELERISGLNKEEARKQLLSELESAHKKELGEIITRLEREKRDQIESRSVEIITSAIQRYSRTSVADVTTSTVRIPDEDIKGKIIGREGRNIKAFERLTGVEVVIDETPDSILLSSFDPLRREIARIALEKLIKDGRIQPAKIEEKEEEAKQEIDQEVRRIGEEAAYEIGIIDLPKEITYILGRLNYRTSYGQNVLLHSIEMAHIAGMIAAELNLNVDVAKRGALLHDIGKAIDQKTEGTHVEIGRKLLKKYGIDEKVIQAMEAHHEEYPHAIPEAFVVSAADAISGARPAARRDTLEKYLKRLEDIEKAVKSFEGITQVYAISAGREVRG